VEPKQNEVKPQNPDFFFEDDDVLDVPLNIYDIPTNKKFNEPATVNQTNLSKPNVIDNNLETSNKFFNQTNVAPRQEAPKIQVAQTDNPRPKVMSDEDYLFDEQLEKENDKPKINVDTDSIIVNDNLISDDEFFDDFFADE